MVVQAARPVRILLVDDDTAIRHLMREILSEEGFETDVAVDGFDALGQLAAESYDAVISDLDMPRLDGLRLLREIRRKGMGIPVIIQTAHLDDSLRFTLWRMGAFRVLSKGQLEELLESLREAIDTSRRTATEVQ